jgi:hypothetical protein
MKPAHCHAGAVQELLVDQHELLHSSSVFSELNFGDVSLNRLLVRSCAFGRRGVSSNLPAVMSQRGNIKMTAAINVYTKMLAASC